MSREQRRRGGGGGGGGGYGGIVLGVVSLAAALGAAYWYFGQTGTVQTTPEKKDKVKKKKSVVIVLSEELVQELPSFIDSKDYYDLYVICPPLERHLPQKYDIEDKVEHPSRILTCATEHGVVHIAKHISADVVLLSHQFSWTADQLKGWAGHVIALQKQPFDLQRDGNVIRISWEHGKSFEDILALTDEE